MDESPRNQGSEHSTCSVEEVEAERPDRERMTGEELESRDEYGPEEPDHDSSEASPKAGPADTRPKTPDPPSREILQGVADRDPAALDHFFETYFDRIYALAARLVGEEALAQDVTQEVFYKVHRAAHQLDPSRDPRHWLTAITYNTCREFWRSGAHKLRRRTVSIQDQPEVEVRLRSNARTPEEEILVKERENTVRWAIDQLPEQLRVAVLLHDYEGLGHEEIATVVGITHAAARKRYSRALSELARQLKAVMNHD